MVGTCALGSMRSIHPIRLADEDAIHYMLSTFPIVERKDRETFDDVYLTAELIPQFAIQLLFGLSQGRATLEPSQPGTGALAPQNDSSRRAFLLPNGTTSAKKTTRLQAKLVQFKLAATNS